jgi:glycosyltransferase involved in cell wall biosynthesis
MSKIKNNNFIVSIGLPIHNGEFFLKTRIDSILNQTFKNFELIISDNASTDQTRKICEEYAKQDSRIQYIRQKKNIGGLQNFKFVLQNAKGKYFVWAAVDDFWKPTFLSKNIEILESNTNIIGSISEFDFFGKYADRYNLKSTPHVVPFSGNYFDKCRLALRISDTMIYGVYLLDLVKKSIPEVIGDGTIFMLSILKFGDFFVHDEILMYRSADGISSRGRISMLRASNVSNWGIIFMHAPLMKWSIKHLGWKFIFANLDSYIRIFLVGYGRVILDILRNLR